MPRVGNCREMIKWLIFNKVDFQNEPCIPHVLLTLFHWIRPKSIKKTIKYVATQLAANVVMADGLLNRRKRPNFQRAQT